MRFGKSAKEAKEEPSRSGSGGDFMRYIKDGSQTFRIIQEQPDWIYYWEHYNPMGFSFPCNSEPDCPGCTSDNEKMKKVSRRIAFNVLQGYNGQDYVNVYKVGTMVSDKLENRIDRFGTITDRDYTVTRYKTSGDRYDFDVEGGVATPVDFSGYELKNIEAMLQEAWDQSWGENADPAAKPPPGRGSAPAGASNGAAAAPAPKRPTIAPAPAPEPSQEVPSEPASKPEKVYQETELRAMEREALAALVGIDMGVTVPAELGTSDDVVDWLMAGQS